jgi:hypothetical protein
MKRIIDNYTFNPTEKKITFNGYDAIELERVLLITNVTRNEIIYSFADPSRGGSVSGNVLTLNYDTTGMSADDRLQIWYEDPKTPALDDGLLKNLLELITSNTSNLDVALSSVASENTLEEIGASVTNLYILLQALLQTPLSRLAIDGGGRLRIVIDAAGVATPVTQSGAWMMPTYSNGSIVFQLANIEYNECQRSKFTFT